MSELFLDVLGSDMSLARGDFGEMGAEFVPSGIADASELGLSALIGVDAFCNGAGFDQQLLMPC